MSEATIRRVGGPVLYARTQGEFRIGEAIEVGSKHRPGEVIRLKGDELVGQVYEDTTGLRPGDTVYGTGAALSVRLGPHLLGHIFDGLLRPLDADESNDSGKFFFCPQLKKGDTFAPGTAIGAVAVMASNRFVSLFPVSAARWKRSLPKAITQPTTCSPGSRTEPAPFTTSVSSSTGRCARNGLSRSVCPPTNR